MTFGLSLIASATAYLGTSNAGIRVLIEPASVHMAGSDRIATIWLGSPRAFAGRIVETRQIERIDCAGRRWGLVSFEAFDDMGGVVTSRSAGALPSEMHVVAKDSIGEIVVDNVCRVPIPKPL